MSDLAPFFPNAGICRFLERLSLHFPAEKKPEPEIAQWKVCINQKGTRGAEKKGKTFAGGRKENGGKKEYSGGTNSFCIHASIRNSKNEFERRELFLLNQWPKMSGFSSSLAPLFTIGTLSETPDATERAISHLSQFWQGERGTSGKNCHLCSTCIA
jgi:hypothetical protein